MRSPPEKRSGPATGPLQKVPPPSVTASSVTDRRVKMTRRLAIAREAHRLMPLTRLYGPRPLLDVPIGHLYVRGRWAA